MLEILHHSTFSRVSIKPIDGHATIKMFTNYDNVSYQRTHFILNVSHKYKTYLAFFINFVPN